MLHRFYISTPFAPQSHVTLTGEELHHAVRVVRVRAGESVELFDGKGIAMRGVVEELDRDRCVVRVEEAVPSRETRVPLHLAMAIINLDKFEFVLQKATELGIRSIIPLETERCEIRPERYRGKGERWNKIVFEAVKQCGRAVIPIVEPPTSFEQAVARDGHKILFDADADPSATQQPSNPATLFIGPEGGWTDAELALARTTGCTFERLGPRRLRAETAAIVATSIISARHDDI